MKQNNPFMDAFWLALSVFGFLLMSVSLLLTSEVVQPVWRGMIFWGGLLLGILPQVVFNIRRKRMYRHYGVSQDHVRKQRIGLLTFGANRIAVVADITLVVSLITSVLVCLITKGMGFLCNLCVAVFLFSFCMHCVFNGRNYFHITNLTKIRQTLESKKVSNGKGEGNNENN